MKPLRILLATNNYGVQVREVPLANELATAFAREGHHVQVVATSWSSPPGAPPRRYREESGVEVLFLTPRQLGRHGTAMWRLTKWLATPTSSYRAVRKELAGQEFDLMVALAPAVASAGAIVWGAKRSRKRLLWIPDFFPFHHRLLGQIPGGPVFQIARIAENKLFRVFDVLACFNNDAIGYLRRHYRLEPNQIAAWIPQWGEVRPLMLANSDSVRTRYQLPADRTIAIFGGQIEVGRGIPDILEAARLATSSRPDLFFLFVGRGGLTGLVREEIQNGASNIGHIEVVPREEYLQILAGCDVGLVATVADLQIPAFPSKTWDYLRAGLPVAASVEFSPAHGSDDYGRFVEEAGFGRAVEAGDPPALLACIASIVDDPAGMAQMRAKGLVALDTYHEVGKNAARMLELTGLA